MRLVSNTFPAVAGGNPVGQPRFSNLSRYRRVSDMQLFGHQSLKHELLTPQQERQLTQRIFRIRTAFERRAMKDLRVIHHVTGLIRQWEAGRFRIDGLCQVALNNRALRNQLEPRLRINVVTIESLASRLQGESDPGVRRRLENRLIRLVEELSIRHRHFRLIPLDDPLATRLLDEYSLLSRELAAANLRLVFTVTRGLCGGHHCFADMIQEGVKGLMRAVTKFDYRRELRFSTYATPWIRQAVMASLKNYTRTIRIPEHFHSLTYNLSKQTQDMIGPLTTGHRVDELAERNDVSPADIDAALVVQRDTQSLDQPNDDHDNGSALVDVLDDRRNQNPRQDAQRRERDNLIQDTVNSLKLNEREVIMRRFGLIDGTEKSLSQIGRELRLTRERVRQIQNSALEKIEAQLTPFLDD